MPPFFKRTLLVGALFAIPLMLSSVSDAQQHASSPFEIASVDSSDSFSLGYRKYLRREFPATFQALTVNAQSIDLNFRISDKQVSADEVAVAVLPTHVPSHFPIKSQFVVNVGLKTEGINHVATISRKSPEGTERSHCRFTLVTRRGDQWSALTPATYPTRWAPGVRRDLKPVVGKTRKGLGGVPADAEDSKHPIYHLGLSHVTVNIVLDRLIHTAPQRGFEPWRFENRIYYLNQKILMRYDRLLEQLRAHDTVVSMILLVSNRRPPGTPRHPLVHPDATADGLFAMPDLTNEKSACMYRAVLHQLAERWSRPGPKSGRVTNWIMHNEIDQSGTWTNMGNQSIEQYLETYTRSARLMHQVAGQFDPRSRVFISLTHFWTKLSDGQFVFRVRDLLDLFALSSVVEGDFPWGVAYHPYPQSLRQPRTWNDPSVRFDYDTPFITPRNIEVLPAYLDQPRLRYLGKQPRAILLSEQGCSSPTLSKEDQKVQAAGIVYMYLRMKQLPTVEAFHYHAFKDSPEVEHVRLGLVDENLKPKFAWKVYQALGTIGEGDAIKFAFEIMDAEARQSMTSVRRVNQGAVQDSR